MLDRNDLSRISFVLSALLLAFLYGFVADRLGLFPSSVLDRAYRQARSIYYGERSLHFLERRVYEWEGVRSERPAHTTPGLTAISSIWGSFDDTPGVKVFDDDGRLLHQWQVDPTELFPRARQRFPIREWARLRHRPVHDFHIFPDGDVLVNVGHVGLARLDACGRARWRLPMRSHHSLSAVEGDSSYWVSGRRYQERAHSRDRPDGYPGLRGDVYHPYAVKVTAAGELVREVSLLDVLYDSGLHRYITKYGQGASRDLSHLNDVEPLPASDADEYASFETGDLLVSLRNLDLVFIADPETKRVEWHATAPFIGQHDPDFMRPGRIGVFDNNRDGTTRGGLLGGSRIVALQPDDGSLDVPFPTSRSEPFYTSYGGKWQQLGNGNYLLTESNAGRVVEVDSLGRSVWEWSHAPYDGERTYELYEATRTSLTTEDVLSWPCSPERESELASRGGASG